MSQTFIVFQNFSKILHSKFYPPVKSMELTITFLVTVLVASKLSQSEQIDCDSTTKKSLQAKLQLAKFEHFFSEFKPLKSYNYNTTMYTLGEQGIKCFSNEFNYKVRLNWFKKVGILQFYTNWTRSCNVFTLLKDGKGFLQARGGIFDNFAPGQIRIGFYDDRTIDRRIYFIDFVEASVVTEFWIVNSFPTDIIGEGEGTNCNKTLLFDLRSNDKPRAGINRGLIVICYFLGAVTGVAAVVWLVQHCLQEIKMFGNQIEAISKE